MEHAEFDEVYGGCDGPVDAADVHRERTPVHSSATGPNYFRHHPLRSSSTYNASFFQPSGGFAPAPFPPYNGAVGSSAGAEHMLSSLVEAQSKVFKMVENVSKRLGDLENVVSSLADKASESVGSSSPEEKKRLPPQLSVSVCLAIALK